MKKVKKKISLFAAALMLCGVLFSLNINAQCDCNDWDNYFDGFSCVGSGAYCWGGEGNQPQ